MTSPDNSDIFDLLQQNPANSAQFEFYERLIKEIGEPVLELGGGDGQQIVTLSPNLQAIAEAAFDERSANSAGAATDLYIGDMRSFHIEQKFKLILAVQGALQHLTTNEDVLNTLGCIKKHLLPGGKLLLEVENPDISALSRKRTNQEFIAEYQTDSGWVVITESFFYNRATQIKDVRWFIKTRQMAEARAIEFKMRQIFPQELDVFLLAAGFKVIAKVGDFDDSPFAAESPKQIVLAESF